MLETVLHGLYDVVAVRAVGNKKCRFKNKLVRVDSTVIGACTMGRDPGVPLARPSRVPDGIGLDTVAAPPATVLQLRLKPGQSRSTCRA